MSNRKDNRTNLTLNKPGLFTPTVVRGLRQGAAAQSVTFKTETNQLADSSIRNTGSFKYSIDGEGLRSTQQLNIDWANFENHTFYNSAQVKTNVAFEKIFNEFPFDGTQAEFENFFASLTGFERYIYQQFPKNLGYFYFSGTLENDGNAGTYITVKDAAGAAYPTVSKVRSGNTVLNPGLNSMTIEFWLYLPAQANSASTVIDKHVDDGTSASRQGFYISLAATGSATSGSMSFHALSGSIADTVAIELDKGAWNHIAYVWDRSPSVQRIFGYVNQKCKSSSSQPIEFGNISSQTANLTIGSGSAITGLFTPVTTFSGAMDELRFWSDVRTAQERNQYKQKSIFADSSLLAYYKFNEPSGSGSPIVLDHSNNALHGTINTNGLMLNVRNFATGGIAGRTPMAYEKLNNSPILFPSHPDLISTRTDLLLSASRYDLDNPNLITKLIPIHYFLEGQSQDGLETIQGEITETLQAGTDPRSVNLGATQVFLLLLYTWAKFFDEMKLYVQAFSSLNAVDYNETDTVPDQFLQFLAGKEGVTLPPLFTGASVDQFINAENIQSDISTNDVTLQAVRNQIWRRILINLQDVVRSKGTLHAVKSFIRSTGIDPDNNFRIREYGGPNKLPLRFVRDRRNEISTMVEFISGGLLRSPYLISTRTEPGYPESGPVAANNTLLTSGSWTYEAFYKLAGISRATTSQSLVRFHVTGTAGSGSSTTDNVIANLVTVKGGHTTLYVRPQSAGSIPMLSMSLTGADLFDGNKWYVSFGRRRNDDNLGSIVSSSYFLRLAKPNLGEIIESYSTSSYFNDNYPSGSSANLWQAKTDWNTSGSFFVIGSQSINQTTGSFVNDSQNSPTEKVTNYLGRVSQIKFYSKYLNDNEWPEHARYYRSVGVTDPKTNFNFTTTPTGSWQRLRIDASTDQPVTQSNSSGEIHITDFSQKGFTLTGSNFLATASVIKPEKYFFSYLSPKFDQAATTEKVRVRSFQSFDNVQNAPWASVAPVHEIVRSEEPTDSTKFTIDYSVVDALDQDIVTLFANLDSFNNTLGNPELLFSPDYPDLESLREVYFNKLTDKMNLKLFFEFYKWFDTNIGTFVAQLIPNKTNFLGTNFVIESHMLERAKVEYLFADMYLGDNNRHSLKDTILLRLITGDFSKY